MYIHITKKEMHRESEGERERIIIELNRKMCGKKEGKQDVKFREFRVSISRKLLLLPSKYRSSRDWYP